MAAICASNAASQSPPCAAANARTPATASLGDTATAAAALALAASERLHWRRLSPQASTSKKATWHRRDSGGNKWSLKLAESKGNRVR